MHQPLPARVEPIYNLLSKVSPALAKAYLWREIAHWQYWNYGHGVYVKAARNVWWHASLVEKFWLTVEDIFATYGNLEDHGDDGITEAVGSIGKLDLLIYRGHQNGHDTLFWGNRTLRSHEFYNYLED